MIEIDGPLSPELVQHLVAEHSRLEFAHDMDGLLASISDEPFWEFHPLGMRAEGRDAVRIVYEQMLDTVFDPDAPAFTDPSPRIMFCDDRSLIQECGYRIRLPDGSVGDSQSVACFEFEADGRLISERIYASGAMVPMIEAIFPASIWSVPGITRL